MPHKITVPQRKNHRIGVFVDVSNMYHSAKNLYKSRVNFRELLKEEKAFFEALEKAGYELKSKDLQIFPGGMKKGDWDVAIAIDAITLSKLVDVVVLVSGDGDYEPLVDFLKFNGTIVEVVGFKRSASSKLIDVANNFTDLEELKEKILLK